jgi:hypothetical protein
MEFFLSSIPTHSKARAIRKFVNVGTEYTELSIVNAGYPKAVP